MFANFLLLVIFYFIGSTLAKFFFLNINQEDFYNIFKDNFKTLGRRYLLIPIQNYKLLKSKIKESKLDSSKFSKLLKIGLVSEVFGGIIFAILSIFIFNSITSLSIFSFLLYSAVIVIFTCALLYLAVYDIITFSVPENFVKILSFFAVLVNLIIGVVKILSADFGHPLLSEIPLGNMGNLLAGVAFALLVFAIVKISKEKGMGEGDIYLVMVIGLMLGWPNTLISFLSTLILGSVISIAFAIYIKKFKDVLVPFVPLLLLGFVVALSFGSALYSNLFFI